MRERSERGARSGRAIQAAAKMATSQAFYTHACATASLLAHAVIRFRSVGGKLAFGRRGAREERERSERGGREEWERSERGVREEWERSERGVGEE